MQRHPLAWGVMLGALLLAPPAAAEERDVAFGMPGDPARVTRTIAVRMSDDMRFSPATIEVRQGDIVRFLVTNAGALDHEMVLGDADTLARRPRHARGGGQGRRTGERGRGAHASPWA